MANKLRMYILIKDTVPVDFSPLVMHGLLLAGYLHFQDDPDTMVWASSVFHKVVCSVNEKEFQNAKLLDGRIVTTASELNGDEVAIVFKPRLEWPKPFKFYKLWKSQNVVGVES